MNIVNIKLKEKHVDKYKSGFPLILKSALSEEYKLKREGDIVNLRDKDDNFIARGYYGLQNKGCGWVLTRKEDEQIDLEFFRKKFIIALNKRVEFFNSEETNAFRVFNGEGDGIGGLTVDYFDGFFVINWYSVGIYEFREFVLDSIKTLTAYRGIYEKKRFNEEGRYISQDDFVTGTRAKEPLVIRENNVDFAVYLNEGAMVGIFLDQREVRKKIRDEYSKDKEVLNTFSYTGAFSVYAALGGAKKTTSVDLANRSLSKTIEQFSLNDIDYESQEIVVEDVFKYFKYAKRRELLFDLVILDPPSFAKSKNFVFSADKDYKNLLKEAVAITRDKGVIVASTNCSSFNMEKFKEFIREAFCESGIDYELLEEFTLPNDFKTIKEFSEGDYLKVVFIKKLDKRK